MPTDLTITRDILDTWTLTQADTLPVVAGVNNVALLRALCMQESSYGVNALPRHENGWCPNQHDRNWRALHRVAVNRHATWGCLACCSYGPLQILYHTAADWGFVEDPRKLLDQQAAFTISLSTLTRKILRDAPRSVRAIADGWNSGTSKDSFQPEGYMASVQAYYEQELKRLQ